MKEGKTSDVVLVGRLLADMEWHTTKEICDFVTGRKNKNTLLAVAARVHNLRKYPYNCRVSDARGSEAITDIQGIRRYRCEYMPQEARVKLGIPLPCPTPSRERQETLFDLM